MSSTTIVNCCSGCFPHYQPNQLAHMEPDGCLYSDPDGCTYSDPNGFPYSDKVEESSPTAVEDTFESFIEALYREEQDSLVVEGGLDSLFEKEEEGEGEGGVDGSECCICYESIDKTKNNCTTECGHTFCLKCLMTSMMHDNFACPCCRADLVDLPKEEEEEDDDETIGTEDSDEEGGEEEEAECDVEELTRRLEASGFNMQDMLSMLLGRYSKDMTDAKVYEINKKFDTIIDESDTEALEMADMGLEDLRTIAMNDAVVV